MKTHSEEVRYLYNCIRDLVALAALPAVWTGSKPVEVAEGLADVLLSTLRLDVVCISLKGHQDREAIEIARSGPRQNEGDQAHEIRKALAPWLAGERADPLAVIASPTGTETVRVVAMPIGYDRTQGVLVAGCRQADFPTEIDRLLLNVAANQAAIALQEAQLLADLHKANMRAQEAVRVRDEFLSIASHELKTPLTALAGNAQLLQRRANRTGAHAERDQRAVGAIIEQASRLNEMIDALLDVSYLQTGQFTITASPLDLCALSRRLVEEVEPSLTQHTMQLDCSREPLMIVGDELRLGQVLRNLIHNAIKYSPADGPITLQVEQRENWACVAVTDQGLGIPEEAQAQLFERFYRANNTRSRGISGMGIGPYVVKEIVALHGGTLEVNSAEGKGSTFTFCLPVSGVEPGRM